MNAIRRFTTTALTATALLATGCGGQAEPAEGTTPTARPATVPTPPKPPPATGTLITLGPSQFGRILFDGRGQAIYLFAKEKTSRPECYGACAAAWPPVYAKGRPRAGRGISTRLLGTTRRRDGSLQVTYGGHPLYYYVNEGPREVRCHNVFLNGGLWLVVAANGRAVS